MSTNFQFLLDEALLKETAQSKDGEFQRGDPFPHVVIDGFLPQAHVELLVEHFPGQDHPVWRDWRKRSPNQYGKQGPGSSRKFSLLEPLFLLALQEFNSWKFLKFLERLTGVSKLLPDPYFSGGGIHQILKGGILDIHTDFNEYGKLDLFRRLNVLIYLNKDWQPSYEGCLELWNGGGEHGHCVKSVAPILNRAVIFQTDKHSFHGHPKEWNAPEPITRKSLAFYYYTSRKANDQTYDSKTDYQGISVKALPEL